MGDRDPKNIEKLREQAEEEKEEAIEYKHKSPAEKEADKEREDAIKETKQDREYGEEPEPTDG